MPEATQCPACEFVTDSGGRFCPSCGGKLGGALAAGPVQPAVPSPAQVASTAAPYRPKVPDSTGVWGPPPGFVPEPRDPRMTIAPPSARPTAREGGRPPMVAIERPGQENSQAAARGGMCFKHTSVAAVARCGSCDAGICAVCDYLVPSAQSAASTLNLGGSEPAGQTHLCPACAADAESKMGVGPRVRLIAAFLLATWTTAVWIIMFIAFATGMVKTESEAGVLGDISGKAIGLPSLVGLGLSLSSIDRKRGTPYSVWSAVAWNSALVGFMLVALIIAFLK
jgi:hypothetical protein